MANVDFVESRIEALHEKEEQWKRDHIEAMQFLDMQELVDSATATYSGLRDLLMDSHGIPAELIARSHKLQLRWLEIAREIEQIAQGFEEIGFTFDGIKRFRKHIADLQFAKRSINNTILALERLATAEVKPLAEIFDVIRAEIHRGSI